MALLSAPAAIAAEERNAAPLPAPQPDPGAVAGPAPQPSAEPAGAPADGAGRGANLAAPQAQRVEVTGNRADESEQRRLSSAAKIIIGRDDIERFGDASLGDLIKRLPGVTVGGRPGRGGGIRMRGLGGGYTQILLDGERVQGGLSLESIDPDMVERIEISRGPTAETGARAIAGTINIITREGFRKRFNDLKLSVAQEQGLWSPSAIWSRSDRWGDVAYNVALNVQASQRAEDEVTRTTAVSTDPMNPYDYTLQERSRTTTRRQGMHGNARLQWDLGEGATLMLMPLLVASQSRDRSQARQEGSGVPPAGAEWPDAVRGASKSDMLLARANAQWRTRWGPGRFEGRGGVAASRLDTDSWREERRSGALSLFEDHSTSSERNASLNAKYAVLVADDHSLVAGTEADVARRREALASTEDGKVQLAEFGDAQDAATQRLAAYVQDEWTLSPRWAAHAGVRWEGITTRGDDARLGDGASAPVNRSSVWTPLLHGVWKPDPKSRDQVRVSLTRSYRSPTLQNLLARPVLSTRYPTDGPNSATSPDRAGNPALRPELATGIDVALERYLPGGGMLSVNVFYRRLQDVIRTVTALESVSWSNEMRWVARPQNIGSATTQGVELEAKGRLTEWWTAAPALDVRANLSVFHSRVDGVPGPDNRLDQQPGGTANLGADYRWPGRSWTLGANLNFTPGYTTRLSDTQWVSQSAKRGFDAYALWSVSPSLRWRLSAGNVLAESSTSTALTRTDTLEERAVSQAPTNVNLRLQLELKL